MKAVVLAGGVRSGLEIPGSGLPRALWPFPHDPLITSVLNFLKNHGVTEIAICANGKTRLIASELSNPDSGSPWLNIHYSEDPLPRGPAGCLRDLQPWLGEKTFIAIQATGRYNFDLAAMASAHSMSGAAITVGARPSSEDPSHLEPAGVYLVNPATLSHVQPVGYQDFKEQFLPKVIAAGELVHCHTLAGQADLIHSTSHYLDAVGDAIRSAASDLPAGFQKIAPNVFVHESAKVSPTARISGPCWIDADVTVADNAILSGPVLLAPGSSVGAGALVHRSVAMRQSSIAARAEVFSSVLAPNSSRSGIPSAAVTVLPFTPRKPGLLARTLARFSPTRAAV